MLAAVEGETPHCRKCRRIDSVTSRPTRGWRTFTHSGGLLRQQGSNLRHSVLTSKTKGAARWLPNDCQKQRLCVDALGRCRPLPGGAGAKAICSPQENSDIKRELDCVASLTRVRDAHPPYKPDAYKHLVCSLAQPGDRIIYIASAAVPNEESHDL